MILFGVNGVNENYCQNEFTYYFLLGFKELPTYSKQHILLLLYFYWPAPFEGTDHGMHMVTGELV